MPIEISVPGSKSITNRVLFLAALAKNKIQIENAAICTDTDYMISCLKDLGIEVEQQGAKIQISGCNNNFPQPLKSHLYTHNAGTTTRFITALASLIPYPLSIDGDERMRERPIGILTEALQTLGKTIRSQNGYLPLQLEANILEGGESKLPGNISSQYISAILLSTPFAKKDSKITITGELCSKPYIEITLKVLADFGIKIENKDFREFQIKGRQSTNNISHYHVESDASGASYPAAYIALHPEKELLLKNINENSIQGDIAFLQYLKQMGCEIIKSGQDTRIKGTNELKSLGEIDMNKTPDLVMTFAVLAAFTPGETTIKNIANLKIKETDRLAALENELKKLGVEVKSGEDYIKIKHCSKFKENITIKTYNDHRMAMSFAIARDRLQRLKIENPACTEKSYKNFWQDLNLLES